MASFLAEQAGLRFGDRVLLIYPPGLQVMAAFFACLRLGVIPVPLFAPAPMAFKAGFAKIQLIAENCQAMAALSTRDYSQSCRQFQAKEPAAPRTNGHVPNLRWVTTDDTPSQGHGTVRDIPNQVLFLQYTSGSTGDPKGVMVTHKNVLHNARSTVKHCPTGLSWLPHYHDLGLIGHYFFALVQGGSNHAFAPFDFLRRPALWLQMISRTRATITTAPNFAFEYCLRPDKLADQDLQGVDLSSLKMMMNAAEPVRAETMCRFRERFAPIGLAPEAFVVGYGLAENTLGVSLHGKQILSVNKQQLQQRALRIERPRPHNNNQLRLVSCGKPLPGILVRIVDPDSGTPLDENQIGEIWVDGDSKCAGYWQKPELTRATFQARIQGEPESSYLRTGDLGFLHEGELFVCGRVKDMIIIHGVNYYPQDIEAIVEASYPKVAKGGPGRTVAFAVDEDGEERLVVVVEVRDRRQLPDGAALAGMMRARYFIEPWTILFVSPHAIPKTTSGKISRNEARTLWQSGALPVLATWSNPRQAGEKGQDPKDFFRAFRATYNLTGQEEMTFQDIGLDSLTLVDLILEVQQFFSRRGASELVEAVDARFLQRLQVAKLFALIDAFEARPNLPVDDLRRLVGVLQEEIHAKERACMRADAEWSMSAAGLPLAGNQPGQMLLTGATGFFGPFLLDSLLRQTSSSIHVLIRATDPDHGLDRLLAGLRRTRVWTPRLQDQVQTRVRIVPGDLARENLGLVPRQWQALAEQAQAILHGGALVNYVLSYEAFKADNVGGTRELLKLACTKTKKAFHLISSTFIAGWTPKKVLWESDHNADMEQLDFGYAQTKWVAEQLVLGAEKHGLPARIYRPSLLTPSSGCVGSKEDIVIRLLAFMIKHGLGLNAVNQISFLPVDVAADNIVSIFKRPQAAGTTFHVTADHYYNIMDVTRLITEQFGYSFVYYEMAEFIQHMNRLCTKEDPLYPLLVFCNRSYRKIEAMRDKRYDNQNYRRARAEIGAVRAEPPLADTVSYLIRYMLREGLIPAKRPIV